ncbi:hypothetical protein M601_003495 [Cellulophaga baltica 4]|nr:hypothetical protein M601_003495 [Cellulophaga baltica 4]
MESQPYKRAEHHFESEISRIEKATIREREQLAELESRFETEIYSEFEGKFSDIESEEGEIRDQEEKFEKDFRELESRYFNKIGNIGNEQEGIARSQKQILQGIGSEDQIRARIRSQQTVFQRNIEGEIKREEQDIEYENSIIEGLREEEGKLRERIRNEFDEAIKNNASKLPKGVTNILEAQRMGCDFEIAKCENERYKRAYELFKKGAWKNG